MSFGDRFRFTLITNDVALAVRADASGVDTVGVDLERLGKALRQPRGDTRLSEHSVSDLEKISRSLRHAQPFARLNPLNADSPCEVDAAIAAGAQRLMLPFFRAADEVRAFVGLVSGRARVSVLIETASALVRIRSIVAVPGIDDVMLGLNDLRLELRLNNHFELLTSPVLDAISREVRDAGLAFSYGGVTRANDLTMPVPADLVLAQYPRLGATGAWLSRSFLRNLPATMSLADGVASIRERLTAWSEASPDALKQARIELAERCSV